MISRKWTVLATTLVFMGIGLWQSASEASDLSSDPGKASKIVPVERVGFAPGDIQPQFNLWCDFGEMDIPAFDYGNRSMIIDLGKAWLASRIVIASTEARKTEPKLRRETFQIYTSDDNRIYKLYTRKFGYKLTRSDKPGEVWRLELTDLKIFARYIKLRQTYDGTDYGFGVPNRKESVKVYTDSDFAESALLTGLCVDPAQPAGRVTAYVNIDGSQMKGAILEVSAKNAETWKVVSRKIPAKPCRWTPVVLSSSKLKQGGYWLSARLIHDGVVLREKQACFWIHSQAADDSGSTLPEMKPGEALVLRNLPKYCSGGDAFSYSLPYRSETTYCGVSIPKGGKATVSIPLKGEYAVYFAADNPWPAVKINWGANENYIQPTQSDWPSVSGVQEHFAGYGSFDQGMLTIESVDAPVRISYLRVARLTSEEAQLMQYKTDPTHNRRVIVNNDGGSELWGIDINRIDKARLHDYVERYQGTDVEIFEMCGGVTGWVVFPTKYATFWRPGEIPDDQWVRASDKKWLELWNKLENDGMPVFPTITKRGRELGIPVWGSLRMSAYYPFQEQQTIQPFNGKLWHKHPEMRIRQRDGSEIYEMSYAWEAVRRQSLGTLGEMLELGCDGINMDFCRYPTILGYDKPLIDGFTAKYGVSPLAISEKDERWISYRCEVMNDFFRAVKRQTDEIGAKQGRKLLISIRVPATAYRDYGFDPQTWVKEGLVDILIPHYPGLERDFDVRPWVAMVKGTGIKVYPGIEVTKEQTSCTELTDAEIARGVKPGQETLMSADDYRRKVWERYRLGADGAYIFNNWYMRECKSALGDEQGLKRWSCFEDPMNLPNQQY